jgi:hypothetical protein
MCFGYKSEYTYWIKVAEDNYTGWGILILLFFGLGFFIGLSIGLLIGMFV